MKRTAILLYSISLALTINAQTAAMADSAVSGSVTVIKDARLEILAKKEAEFNKATVGLGARAAKGYRLMVVNSNDRNLVMKVRSQLLQSFPEQKVYMTFQAPFIKLKFGNFVEKTEAERYKKLISSAKIVTTNIYLVPETVEVKPDKEKDEDDK
jgi:hypothetical protein